MNLTFNHLSLKNFRSLTDVEFDLYDRTIIKGVNAVGKSTLADAIYWILFDKNADGTSADVKPRDKDGEEVHNLITTAILTMTIDGKVIKAQKTLTENWLKNKTTQENVYKGNENSYMINDIPKKKADYEEYFKQFIDLDELMFCMNPKVFLNLNTKDRRIPLISLIDNPDELTIATDERFEVLRNELMDGTIEQLITRSKHNISTYKKDIEVIPARIAQEQTHIKEISPEEEKAFAKELTECQKKLDDFEVIKNTSSELSKRITDAKNELSRLDSDERIAQQKAEANSNIEKDRLTQAIAITKGTIQQKESHKEEAKRRLADLETTITDYADSIKNIEAETFDDTNLVCPVCGSKYTKAKTESLRKAWQESQEKKIANLKHLIEDSEVSFHNLESEIKKFDEDIKELQADIKSKEKELSVMNTMPAPVEVVDNSDKRKKITADIEKWEKELETLNLSTGTDKQELVNRIAEIKVALSQKDINKASEAEIDKIRKEQLGLSQNIADEEKMLDLLNDYQRAKIDLVTGSINEYFEIIKWRFFRPQINGGYAECCEALVDGISLDKTLNHGHKLLAQLDLCQAFQRKAEITAPLMLDDCESIDEWRIPQVKGQLIAIRRTDDKGLSVEPLA